MLASSRESRRGLKRGYVIVKCKQRQSCRAEGYINCYIEIPKESKTLPEGFCDWEYIVNDALGITRTYRQSCHILTKPGQTYRYWIF